MRLATIKYLLVFTTPIVVLFSLSMNGLGTYFALVFVFAFIPLLEFLFKGNENNLTELEEAIALEDKTYDYIIWSLVPMQVLTLVYFLVRISDPSVFYYEKVGMMTAFGISCGVLGINAAHELGHRVTKHEQLMSKILLCTTLYMHFFIEHNRGHHKNVSTDEDPASSRYGENVYAFFVRSVRDSWLSAWQIEKKRLEKAQQNFWSWHNEMLVYQIIQAALLVIIALSFNVEIMFWFLSLMALGSAAMVVASKSPVYSILYLILTFFAISGHYILLNAQFLAIVNVIVYAGAIMVLFLFVIMLMNLNKETEPQKNRWLKLRMTHSGCSRAGWG